MYLSLGGHVGIVAEFVGSWRSEQTQPAVLYVLGIVWITASRGPSVLIQSLLPCFTKSVASSMRDVLIVVDEDSHKYIAILSGRAVLLPQK